MVNKKLINKEITVIHWLLLTTSKLLIGIGIGVTIATHFWYAQPYWYLIIILGAIILIPTLYSLMKMEGKEQIILKKKLKR